MLKDQQEHAADRTVRAARRTDTMRDDDKTGLDRRSFLRAFGGASTVAVAATATVSDPAEAYDPGEEETRSRYQESDHVKAFYRVNSYPASK
jgi:hypothetical protein